MFVPLPPGLNYQPNPPGAPNGLYVIQNWITEAEEQAIVDFACQPGADGNHKWSDHISTKRPTQHYGYRYEIYGYSASTEKVPADWGVLRQHADRIETSFQGIKIAQCLANLYWEDTTIGAHRDRETPIVFGLSTVGDINMIWSHVDDPKVKYEALIPRRSLYIMMNDAALKWKHEVPMRKTVKYFDNYGNVVQTLKKTERYARLSVTYRHFVGTMPGTDKFNTKSIGQLEQQHMQQSQLQFSRPSFQQPPQQPPRQQPQTFQQPPQQQQSQTFQQPMQQPSQTFSFQSIIQAKPQQFQSPQLPPVQLTPLIQNQIQSILQAPPMVQTPLTIQPPIAVQAPSAVQSMTQLKSSELVVIRPPTETFQSPENHIYPTHTVPGMEACHLQGIIPMHAEKDELLFSEHNWTKIPSRFGTFLSRLVCGSSEIKSRTSGIYAKWVELFCEKVLGVRVVVQSGFANLYPSGNATLPAHRDEYGCWIFGLSFGETRTFDFVANGVKTTLKKGPNPGDIIPLEMKSGDILLFSTGVNKTHKHRILAEPNREGRRINITYFIMAEPGEDESRFLNPPVIKANMIPTFQQAEELFMKSLADRQLKPNYVLPETNGEEPVATIVEDDVGRGVTAYIKGVMIPFGSMDEAIITLAHQFNRIE